MYKKLFSIFFIIICVCSACKKDPDVRPRPVPIQPPVPPSPMPPPNPPGSTGVSVLHKVGINDDFVVSPANTIVMYGYISFMGINDFSFNWKQLSGQNSISFDTPDSLYTTVRHLEKGAYSIELTATSKDGIIRKDTATIQVREEGTASTEIILKDQEWSCPMGCVIEVVNFNSYVPDNKAFKVYVKVKPSSSWIEASRNDQNNQFLFGVNKNILWIYGYVEETKSDIRITY